MVPWHLDSPALAGSCNSNIHSNKRSRDTCCAGTGCRAVCAWYGFQQAPQRRHQLRLRKGCRQLRSQWPPGGGSRARAEWGRGPPRQLGAERPPQQFAASASTGPGPLLKGLAFKRAWRRRLASCRAVQNVLGTARGATGPLSRRRACKGGANEGWPVTAQGRSKYRTNGRSGPSGKAWRGRGRTRAAPRRSTLVVGWRARGGAGLAGLWRRERFDGER